MLPNHGLKLCLQRKSSDRYFTGPRGVEGPAGTSSNEQSHTCGLEHHTNDGRHFLYAYNCSSPKDELYDLDSVDAVNLIEEPAYANVWLEMIRQLGVELEKDPRFVGYWAEFRIARFHELPTIAGDMQLFTRPS